MSNNSSISSIRKDYQQQTLLESTSPLHPIELFTQWWNDAEKAAIDERNAMTLATASPEGVPSARIVLLKDYDDKGFVFYTNYNSFKGLEMKENPRACLVFFWKELERQVRITGIVEKTSTEESDAYFQSRPIGSRIGAWASQQSEVIADRDWIESNEKKWAEAFEGKEVPRPEHWGGYRVKPVNIEFWQGRPSRLHDRLNYHLNNEGKWIRERLSP